MPNQLTMVGNSVGARPTEAPPKTSRGARFIRKQNGRKGGFTQNAIFIRFLMNELHRFVLHKMRLRPILHLRNRV